MNEESITEEESSRKTVISSRYERLLRLFKFVIVSLGGWGLTELVVFIMLLILGREETPSTYFKIWFISVYKIHVATFTAILLVMVYNYILNKIWTFRKQEKKVQFKTTIQFIKFALVGASGTVVNLGLVHLFAVILNLNEYLATSIGFLVSVLTNFILNDIWTFNPKFGQKILEEN